MKDQSRSSISLLALAVALVAAACGEAFAAPEIACDEPVLQFGLVEGSNSIERTFVLWNRGDTPLVIGKTRGCCGASVAVADSIVAPGSNTTLKVALNLSGRNGEVKKSIYIASNDPKQPYLQVQLVGTVRPSILVEPGSLDFGSTVTNEVLPREVMITSLPAMPLRVTNVVSAGAQFQAEVIAASNNFCRILVRTVPPLPRGVTHGKITAFTDSAAHPSLEIPVLVTVASDIVIVPESIVLTHANGQPQPVSRFFAVRSRTGAAFHVLRVEPPDPGIESVLTPLASGGWRCELRHILPFAELDGKKVIIATDHPTSHSIAVPIRVVQEAGK